MVISPEAIAEAKAQAEAAAAAAAASGTLRRNRNVTDVVLPKVWGKKKRGEIEKRRKWEEWKKRRGREGEFYGSTHSHL